MAAAPLWKDSQCEFVACMAQTNAACVVPTLPSAQAPLTRNRVFVEVPEGWVLTPLSATSPSGAATLAGPCGQPLPLRQPQWQQPQWPQWPVQQQPAAVRHPAPLLPPPPAMPAVQQQAMQPMLPQQQFLPQQPQRQAPQAFLQAPPTQVQRQQCLMQQLLQQPLMQAAPSAAAPQARQRLQEQPPLELVGAGSAQQGPQKLTRGARRHLKQRLRKKLGKLERARAAAELATQQECAEEDGLAAGPCSRCFVDTDAEHWSDSDSTEAPHSQTSPMSSLWTSEEDESEGQDTPAFTLEDGVHLPADPLVGLLEGNSLVAEEPCIRSRGRSPQRMECKPQAAIPTKNTFVHFPMERQQPPRRSRSV